MDFLNYFNEKVCKIRLVEKTDSAFMKLINFGLAITNFLGITDIKDFLTGYGTTIGRTIYDHPKWAWSKPVTPHVVHELTHVLEWSFWYALQYLFSARLRAYYESVCIQTEWIIFPKLFSPEALLKRADKLVSYGISRAKAVRTLEERALEIDNDNPQPLAKRMKEIYEAWENEQGLQ